MRAPLDWITRFIMLVLAGFVSLSIIGTIAAIPSGSIEGRIGFEETRNAPEEIVPDEQPSTTSEEAPAASPDAGPADRRGGAVGSGAPPAPTAEERIADWLEAMTYALLALVGLAALATLVLWRGLHDRRSIADALEARGLPPSS